MKQTDLLRIACGIVAVACSLGAAAQPKLNANNIDEVINAMTLHEKALLVVGTGMEGLGGSANLGTFAKLVPGAAGTTYAIPRLGITSAVLSDGPAGLRINPTRPYDSRRTEYGEERYRIQLQGSKES